MNFKNSNIDIWHIMKMSKQKDVTTKDSLRIVLVISEILGFLQAFHLAPFCNGRKTINI